MDSYDRDTMKELIQALQEATVEELRQLRATNEKISKQNEQLLSVFNKVATGLDTLTNEIRLMRKEITPTLDKPRLPIRKSEA